LLHYLTKFAKQLIKLSPIFAFGIAWSGLFFLGEAKIPKSMLDQAKK
jgi:hypothetical protein